MPSLSRLWGLLSVVLAGSLLLSGCSLFRDLGWIDEAPAPTATTAPPEPPSPPPAVPPPTPQAAGLVAGTLLDQRLRDLHNRSEELLNEAEAEGEEVDLERLRFRMQEVTQRYEAILAANPYAVEPLLLYGKLLRRIGERQYAQEIFLRANALDSNLPVVKQQLGNFYMEEGYHAPALLCYNAAIELDPTVARYHWSLAECLYHYGERFLADGAFERAALEQTMLDAYARAAQLDPANRDFAFRWAEAYYDLATPRWEEALAAWEQVAAGATDNLERDAITLHRARIHYESGHPAEARQLAQTITTEALFYTRDQLLARLGE